MGITEGDGFHVLAVCLGNVCRSPLMEHLLRERLPGSTTVSSAGLRALVGASMEPQAAAELARLAPEPHRFAARQLSRHLAAEADLVLTATAEVRSALLAESPGALRRSFTLLEFAYLAQAAPPELSTAEELVAWAAGNRSLAVDQGLDIVDPMGRSAEVHHEAAELIDKATAEIAEVLARVSVSGHAVSEPQ